MRRFAALCLLLVLPSCGPALVQADVTRFHAANAVEQPHSFTILPDPGQAGSLEFQRYAELTAAQLQRVGWRPLPASGPAETVVTLHWGGDEARTVTWQSPTSVYSGMGWGRHGHWSGAGIGVPFGDPFPYYETRSLTTFPKWLRVEITDAAAAKAGQRVVLFEGRAVTESGGREIAPVVPYLLQALFTGFPGASGTTVRVRVPVE
ncbi:MAG: DUF4136 domain-containing protein [Magnetospirillum sp.]|nr:DUF4136 domain-containing protein [Magnetospirillum sp.]